MTKPQPRTALIIGDRGQDGRYLKRYLEGQGWQVAGLGRSSLTLGNGDVVEAGVDLTDTEAVSDLIGRTAPAHIFYLAAHHASSDLRDVEDPLSTFDKSIATNFLGLTSVLKVLARTGQDQRLCYAASSHIFGVPEVQPQTEAAVMRPMNAYAVSKVAGIEACRLFRRQHKVFASVAILYNHESPLRTADYVTQKVATAAADISLGLADRLDIRNVWALTDWGAASDYVRAMAGMLEIETPDDFIVASGRLRSIAEFAAVAFDHVGLDWAAHVRSHAGKQSSIPGPSLVGDAGKLKAATGWTPKIEFLAMVTEMVDAALARRAAS